MVVLQLLKLLLLLSFTSLTTSTSYLCHYFYLDHHLILLTIAKTSTFEPLNDGNKCEFQNAGTAPGLNKQ